MALLPAAVMWVGMALFQGTPTYSARRHFANEGRCGQLTVIFGAGKLPGEA